MIETIFKKIRHFLADEDGPTAVEYAVMLMLILLTCMTAIQLVGTAASARWSNTAEQIQNMGGGS